MLRCCFVSKRVQGLENPDLVASLRKDADDSKAAKAERQTSWRRTLLLALAVTIHNIPGEWPGLTSGGLTPVTEGLAVGVGFGGIGSTASATFENARSEELS